jgi:hypothetical protein
MSSSIGGLGPNLSILVDMNNDHCISNIEIGVFANAISGKKEFFTPKRAMQYIESQKSVLEAHGGSVEGAKAEMEALAKGQKQLRISEIRTDVFTKVEGNRCANPSHPKPEYEAIFEKYPYSAPLLDADNDGTIMPSEVDNIIDRIIPVSSKTDPSKKDSFNLDNVSEYCDNFANDEKQDQSYANKMKRELYGVLGMNKYSGDISREEIRRQLMAAYVPVDKRPVELSPQDMLKQTTDQDGDGAVTEAEVIMLADKLTRLSNSSSQGAIDGVGVNLFTEKYDNDGVHDDSYFSQTLGKKLLQVLGLHENSGYISKDEAVALLKANFALK